MIVYRKSVELVRGVHEDVEPYLRRKDRELADQLHRAVRSVVLNVAVANVAARSFLSVWPQGEDHPGTANLNLVPGRTIANLVVCRLGEGGALAIGNLRADCDVIADVFGYFVD